MSNTTIWIVPADGEGVPGEVVEAMRGCVAVSNGGDVYVWESEWPTLKARLDAEGLDYEIADLDIRLDHQTSNH